MDNGKPSKKKAKTVGSVDPDEDVDSMDSNSTPKTSDATDPGSATPDSTAGKLSKTTVYINQR